MTPEEEHQAQYVRLHRALDELVACYLSEKRIAARNSIHDEIYDLMKWSHAKTLAPSTPRNEGRPA